MFQTPIETPIAEISDERLFTPEAARQAAPSTTDVVKAGFTENTAMGAIQQNRETFGGGVEDLGGLLNEDGTSPSMFSGLAGYSAAIADVNRDNAQSDFNVYTWVKNLPDGPRKEMAVRLAADGGLDPSRGGIGSSEEEANSIIDQQVRENSREAILANAGVGDAILGGLVSLFDVTTLVPMVGPAMKVRGAAQVAKTTGLFAANGAAVELGVEALQQNVQTSRSTAESVTNVAGAAAFTGILGAGIGVFSTLRRNKAMNQAIMDDIEGPDLLDIDPSDIAARNAGNSAGAMSVAERKLIADDDEMNFIKTAEDGGEAVPEIGTGNGHFIDSVPVFRNNPTSGMYIAAKVGLDGISNTLARLGAMGPFAGHKTGVRTGKSVEDVAAVRYNLPQVRAARLDNFLFQEWRVGAGKGPLDFEARRSWNKALSLRMEDPAYRTGDKMLDDAVGEFVGHEHGYAKALHNPMWEDAQKFRLLQTDQLKKMETLAAERAEAVEGLKQSADSPESARVEDVERILGNNEADFLKLVEELENPANITTKSMRDIDTRIETIKGQIAELEANIAQPVPKSALTDSLKKPKAGSKGVEAERARLTEMLKRDRDRIKQAEAQKEKLRKDRFDELSLIKLDKVEKARSTYAVELKKAQADARQKAAKRLEVAEKRVDRLKREIGNRENYFTHVHNYAAMREDWDGWKAILRDSLLERGNESADMVKMAAAELRAGVRREAITAGRADPGELSEEFLEELVETFEEMGLDGMEPSIVSLVDARRAAYVEQELSEIVDGMRQHSAAQSTSVSADETHLKSSRVKGRRLMLNTATKERLYEAGFMESDVARVTAGYAQNMGSRLAMADVMGLTDGEGVDELIAKLQKELHESDLTPKQKAKLDLYYFGDANKHKGIIRAYIDRLTNSGGELDESNIGWWLSAGRKFTNLIRLGGSTIAAIPDLATLSYAQGIKRSPQLFAAHVKNIARLDRELSKLSSEDLRIMSVGLDNALDAGAASRIGEISENRTMTRGFGTGRTRRASAMAEKALDYSVEKLFQLNVMNRWNKAGKAVNGGVLLQKVVQFGSDVSKMTDIDVTNFARWGLDKSDLQWISKQAKTETDGGTFVPDIDNFPKTSKGIDMRERLLIAMKRSSEEAIITPRKGHMPVFADTALGRTLLQFQGFPLAWAHGAGRRALKGGVLPRDLEAAAFYSMSVFLGMVSYAAREKIKGRDLPDPRSTGGFIKWVRNGIDRSGVLTVASPYVAAAEKLAATTGALEDLGYAPPSRYAEKNGYGLALGPLSGTVADAEGLVGEVARNGLFNKEVLKKTVKILPYNNVWYADAILRRTLYK